MPDDYDDETDEVDEGPVLRKLRKQIKETNEAAEKLAAENATLKRETAFRDAGINPKDPKARYFVKGYEGDLTAEAIKAEAEEAGIIGPEPSTIPEAEIASQERAAEIVMGADTPAHIDRQAEYEAEMAQAVTKQEIYAVMDKYGSPRAEELV